MNSNRIAKFEKVSFEQFKKDWIKHCITNNFDGEKTSEDDPILDKVIHDIYNDIELPKRSTRFSAGYDFKLHTITEIPISANVTIPTGIRCKMNNNWVLMLFPRSGHGFKYGIHLANGVGIIDADYYNADNEGHIMVKLVNDSSLANHLILKSGQAFCQGVFLPYGITEDDNADGLRIGGIGSTDKKNQ
jgi:dUTP pyrophosphatase